MSCQSAIPIESKPLIPKAHIAGVVVFVRPPSVSDTLELLARETGITVHQHDVESGRIVVVHEGADVDIQAAALDRLRRLPGVLSAELVCCFVDEEDCPSGGTQ